jgi:lipopolysaccharide export system ATP-binding protein
VPKGSILKELRTEKLTKSYGDRRVVDEVSVSVREGEVVGLLGPNGAGKTTTFNMIVGAMRPASGDIYLDGEELTHLPMYKRARKGIGYLSQEPSVFRKLTVRKNLEAIIESLPISRDTREEKLDGLLQELNISHLVSRKADSLSGGERRRVEISRALVTDPSFILLDEPFTGIDPIARADIQQIITDLKKKGLGLLITDHNVRETLEITDRAYLIYDGKILFKGTSEELTQDPQVKKVYLGERFKL